MLGKDAAVLGKDAAVLGKDAAVLGKAGGGAGYAASQHEGRADHRRLTPRTDPPPVLDLSTIHNGVVDTIRVERREIGRPYNLGRERMTDWERRLALDPSAVVPLDYQWRERLRAAIRDCEPDTPIPAEKDLMAYAGVSRATARRAIGDLVQEGLLVARQGSGTYTAPAGRGPRAGRGPGRLHRDDGPARPQADDAGAQGPICTGGRRRRRGARCPGGAGGRLRREAGCGCSKARPACWRAPICPPSWCPASSTRT